MPSILIIDDSFTARSMVNRLLSDKFDIVQADGGKAGIETLRSQTFDLVLLDLLMPDMDGFQTLQKIRESHPALPVLIVSADIQESTRKRVLEAGAKGIVNKPPKQDVLLRAIQDLLDRSGAAQEDQVEGSRA